MLAGEITLDDAVELTRTGDIWLFRGRSAADRAIQALTNSPVNHVGMAIVLDDLPPLMWHAELGRSLPDAWTGKHQRGAQLHDLRDAVVTWAEKYGQRAWLRQLEPEATPAKEDAALRSVARLDGTPFPSTAGLAARWWRGQLSTTVPRPATTALQHLPSLQHLPALERFPRAERLRARLPRTRRRAADRADETREAATEAARELETAYCAEILAMTYQAMGLLPADRSPSSYDPGHFWSGDDLRLLGGAALGDEIPVQVPVRR